MCLRLPIFPFLILATISGLLFWSTPVSANRLVNLPLDTEVSDFSTESYAFVQRMLTKRLIPGIPRGSLPFTESQVATMLTEIREKQDRGEISLSPVERMRLDEILSLVGANPEQRHPPRSHVLSLMGEGYDFAFDLAASQRLISHSADAFPSEGTAYITSLLPHVYGQVRDDFAFSTDIGYHFLYGDIPSDRFIDEPLYTHFDGNLHNRVPMNAYLKFRLPWFDLELGQDELRWGPGYHGSLLLSDTPTAMDLVKLQATYRNITFSAFTAVLEDASPDIDAKYLSGHRIEGYLWNRVGLGFSEVVVYGNRFEVSYLNPVNLYLIDEVNTERGDSRATNVPGASSGDNVLFSGDLRIRPMDNLEVYGELMIDDGNPAKDFHHWDTKFGVLGGIYLTDPFGLHDTDLHAEYAFLNQYAYTHENPVNVYKHFSRPLGHFLGPDADDLWIELRHRFTDRLESSFTYELERHGEGGINQSHPTDAPPDDPWTPLSGITESQHRFTLGLDSVDHIFRF